MRGADCRCGGCAFLWPLIIVSDTDHATIPLGLTAFQGQQGTDWNLLMAGATISMLPGMTLSNSPDDYVAFRQYQLARFDGQGWVLMGGLITAD